MKRHPALFGEHGIPQYLGGEPYWDALGRWVGVCLSGYGICYNRDALSRLGIDRPPARWADLADPRLAEVVAAFVELKTGKSSDEPEIIAYCRQRLASFKVPRRVVFVTEWPMTGAGKIQRYVLKESLAANPS